MASGIPKSANELGRSIYFKIACVPSEDTDQPALPPSLTRVFTGYTVGSEGTKALRRTAKTDEPPRMRRRI